MKSDKEAMVAITEWVGAQQRAGVGLMQLLERMQNDRHALAAEIGVTVEQLLGDVFEHADCDEILEAMACATIDDVVKHDPQGGLGRFLNR
mgnify:CR=1 FL=1